MRVILNLNEEILKNLQQYAESQNITINEVIESLFINYIQEPIEIIDKHGLNEIFRFQHLLTSYLNEAIYDLESLIGTDDEAEEDKNIVNVFKKINTDIITYPKVLTELFKAYKNIYEQENEEIHNES